MSDLHAMLERHYQGLNTADLELATGDFAEDVSVALPTGSFVGIDGLRGAMSAFFTAFSDLSVSPRSLVIDGRAAMAERVLAGTHDGPLATADGEVPPTGRSVSLPIVDTFVLEGSKIVEHNVYWDNLALVTQLGLGPES